MNEKTYRELILDLENATKRLANTNGWSSEFLLKQLKVIEAMRETLNKYLDQVPSHRDRDIVEKFNTLVKRDPLS